MSCFSPLLDFYVCFFRHSIGCEEQYLGITIKVILAGSRKEINITKKRPNRLGSLLASAMHGSLPYTSHSNCYTPLMVFDHQDLITK